MTSALVQFLHVTYESKANVSVCTSGNRECSPVCVHTHQLRVQVSMAIWYAAKSGVMSRGASTELKWTLQASNIRKRYAENFSELALPY